MSCCLATLAVMHLASIARADPPATEEEQVTDRRAQIGVQLGGSAVAQLAFRYRIVGPVHVDVGYMGLPHSPINASLGVVVAPRVTGRFFPYGGLGAGLAGIGGRDIGSCPKSGCQGDSDVLRFGYVRVGAGMYLDADHRHVLGLDIGGWFGAHTHKDYNLNLSMMDVSSSTWMLWPMAGLSYLYAF